MKETLRVSLDVNASWAVRVVWAWRLHARSGRVPAGAAPIPVEAGGVPTGSGGRSAGNGHN